MSIRKEKKHHKVCLNKRLDAYLKDGNEDTPYCPRCESFIWSPKLWKKG